ncbi:MAG: hypothetical protein ACO3JL_11490 [Myxococcota bacterium]
MAGQPGEVALEGAMHSPADVEVDVVVPMAEGARALPLLRELMAQAAPPLRRIIVVDQRPEADVDDEPVRARLMAAGMCVIPAHREPTRALQNEGARAGSAPWIAFLDEDVRLSGDWVRCLARDLDGLPPSVAGVQGHLIRGELEQDDDNTGARRRPGSMGRRWDAGDLTLRRSVFFRVGGFDDRFAHPERRDVDLCLRLGAEGYDVVQGMRRSRRPAAEVRPLRALRESRVRIDEMQLYARHGPRWRELSGVFPEEPKRFFGAGLLATSAGAAFHTDLFGTTCVALGIVAARATYAAYRQHKSGISSATGPVDAALSSMLLPVASLWHATLGVIRGATLDEAPPSREAELAPAAVEVLLIDAEVLRQASPATETMQAELATSPVTSLARLAEAGFDTYVLEEEWHDEEEDGGEKSRRESTALRARSKPFVSGWLCCPHRPDEGCFCRRPSPWLILEALEQSSSSPELCLYVTCDERGRRAAAAAGLPCIVVPHPHRGSPRAPLNTAWAADLQVVVDRLTRRPVGVPTPASPPTASSRRGGIQPIDFPLQ